jgi:GH15 family glucan-1,4-alpha-glucosidase
MPDNLQLALIGNSRVAALLDEKGEVAWACLPQVDDDPVFCSLLRPAGGCDDFGYFVIEMLDFARSEQHYLPHTAVVVTRLYDQRGGAVELVDFAPRYTESGRIAAPMTLVRRVRRLAGTPRLCVRLRPAADYGASRPALSYGSNYVRYVASQLVLRLTTDCSILAVVEEVPFVLQGEYAFILGADETIAGTTAEAARRMYDETVHYWRQWVRGLSIPFEWQDDIIRAAITLKLNAVEDTGAIIAAVTTSLPEAAGSARNWDYRYCWLRDAYFVVSALNRLNATNTMERYLDYIINIAARATGSRLQPVYRINGRVGIDEHEIKTLPGYRGCGPVRVGNQAYLQVQNDVYGAAVLAATHVFFDRRLAHQGNEALFQQLEPLGEQAAERWAQADAGPWELRGSVHPHTFSSVMCWGACDRLAKIARRLGLLPRAELWQRRADIIHAGICEQAFSTRRNSFVASFQGDSLDASLLLLHELGFLRADDPRFASTVAAVAAELLHDGFVFRYVEADDFGRPDKAFIVCTFWYIDALTSLGRRDEARALFQNMLDCRNRHGLLAEHIDPRTRELWGNFPQTYSMVGLIQCATRLSIPWHEAF